jgi:hypothetical protein
MDGACSTYGERRVQGFGGKTEEKRSPTVKKRKRRRRTTTTNAAATTTTTTRTTTLGVPFKPKPHLHILYFRTKPPTSDNRTNAFGYF